MKIFRAKRKGRIAVSSDFISRRDLVTEDVLILPNLLIKSEEFDNVAWVKFNATVTINSSIFPFNSETTADSLIENAVEAAHGMTQTVTLPATPHTFSVYAKSAGRTSFAFQEGYSDIGSYFDLGTVSVGANFRVAPTSAGIIDVGGGWYRVWIVATPPGGNAAMGIYMGTAFSYLGDGVSGIIFAGAMINAGSVLAQYALGA